MSARANRNRPTTTRKSRVQGRPSRKSGNPAKPPRKGNLLDTVEDIATAIPGAIRGARSLLGLSRKSEVAFATPASFAMVQNNVTQLSGPIAVTHPRLGIAGQRMKFSQPLGTVRPVIGSGAGFWQALPLGGPALVGPDNFTILLNPETLGGPLAFESARFDRYKICDITVKFVTYQTTTFVGTGAMAIESDVSNLQANSFQTLRMVQPSVTFPYRIPEACLQMVFESDELYYCRKIEAPGATTNRAEARQVYQAALRGWDATDVVPGPAGTCGFVEISGSIEFFDPIPPSSSAPMNLKEHLAVQAVLQAMRPKTELSLPPGSSKADLEWIASLKEIASHPPVDLAQLEIPVLEPNPIDEAKTIASELVSGAAGGPSGGSRRMSPKALSEIREIVRKDLAVDSLL